MPTGQAEDIPQQSAARVSVILVTYNAENYVRQCLEALSQQTWRDFSVLIIDNASTDQTIQAIERDFPHMRLVKRRENQGFARAYNHGLAWAHHADYTLCLNQDAFMEPGYIQALVAFMDGHARVASASGKLLRYDAYANEGTTVIDSLGLAVRRSHRVVNIAEGTQDDHHLASPVEVFGVPATAALYRRAALEQVALRRGRLEYFDEDYFAYKEDVDLAWRLRVAGVAAFIVPAAVAYHVRSARKQARSDRRQRRPLMRQLSYRNHLLTLLVNEPLWNMVLMSPWIITFELGKVAYTLVVEPSTFWKSWLSIMRLLPATFKKRRFVQRLRTVRAKELRAWLH